MDKVINVSDLPKRKHGKKDIIDWINIKNRDVRFNYKGIEGILKVSFLKKVNGGTLLEVIYKDKRIEMYNGNFIKGKIGVLIGEVNKEHKYQVGDVVNNVTILEQTRKKDARQHNILAYKVSCNLTKKEFYQTQFNIDYGYGSPYASGNKVWEGNWLFNEKHILPLLKNQEDAKKHSIGGDGKILCICPNCNREKYMIARNLYLYGVSCQYCGPYLSYPEKFMMAYLEVMGIRYLHQFKLGNYRRFIDFYLPDKNIAIEVHGFQHYGAHPKSKWKNAYKLTMASDEFKREYCKNNGIKLIEIDARKSYFNFIRDSINNSVLPNVPLNKIKDIQRKINERRFNNSELSILSDYKGGKSSNSIALKYNVSVKHVTNIAKRHGVYKNRDRNIKIRCINTNIVYNSISEASKCTGMNASSIGMVCHGKRKYNKGKNGEKIYWEIIQNSNFNTINDIV
ncbi:hypothetical protein [Staphylococcus sp. HMSC14C01]|uniref:hypothetical protein n=1 Tax=Staphylococcus TaxID=1279 RepID=UPI0008A5A5E8|nr:hypothetical protein [Staphylococcus sp. HMSC14C01]OFM64288.1 hypothetical protein HMPREF2672_07170 [Staphylococcus sp. HMSC068D07]OFV21584.1 hypothetical protein HMPREF3131_08780 [Staphylococcus sp. HMSC14C01]